MDFQIDIEERSDNDNVTIPYPKDWLSIVNPETLQSLFVEYRVDLGEAENTLILKDLVDSKLNLMSFRLHLCDITAAKDVALLSSFLQNQIHLRKISIRNLLP